MHHDFVNKMHCLNKQRESIERDPAKAFLSIQYDTNLSKKRLTNPHITTLFRTDLNFPALEGVPVVTSFLCSYSQD